jgi:hypothetical protein
MGHSLLHGRYLIVSVDGGHVLEMHGTPVLTQIDTYVDNEPSPFTATPPSTSVQLDVRAEPVDGLFYTFWAPRPDLQEAIGVLAARLGTEVTES